MWVLKIKIEWFHLNSNGYDPGDLENEKEIGYTFPKIIKPFWDLNKGMPYYVDPAINLILLYKVIPPVSY